MLLIDKIWLLPRIFTTKKQKEKTRKSPDVTQLTVFCRLLKVLLEHLSFIGAEISLMFILFSLFECCVISVNLWRKYGVLWGPKMNTNHINHKSQIINTNNYFLSRNLEQTCIYEYKSVLIKKLKTMYLQVSKLNL